MTGKERPKARVYYDGGVFVPIDSLDPLDLASGEYDLVILPRPTREEFEMGVRLRRGPPTPLLEKILEQYERLSANQLEEHQIWRFRLENEVRILKRRGRSCPYCLDNECQNTKIRCGERQQYHRRENPNEESTPHACLYRPAVSQGACSILVVDDEPEVVDVCVSLLTAVGIARERIEVAHSVEAAEAVLFEGKKRGRTYCVVISDVQMAGRTGYDLVNHLVERNFNSRILLASAAPQSKNLPEHYLGEKEVVPGEPVVSGFLRKPLTVMDLTAHLERVGQSLSGS